MNLMQQSTNSNSSQKVFNNQFIVHKKISSGSFGVVFLGFDQQTNDYVAIKVEKEENEEVKSLEREVSVLTRLKGVDGIPKMYWSGEEQDYNILVIQLLGKDLAHHIKTGRRFSLKTVLQLSDQMVQVLERMHLKGVIHRDLKPENILLGKDEETSKVYLVDFGISKIFRDIANRHISFKDNKPFIGTTRYASIAAHKGYELGRKDDLESMIYVLLFFLKGQLPWQNMQNVTDDERTIKVGEMKMKMNLNELCKDHPNEFVLILEYLRKLTFKSEPDYKFVQLKLKEAADSNKIQYDGIFDWTDVNLLKKTVTLQDNKPPSSSPLAPPDPDKMKVSNKMGQSSVNFLIPPDPRNNLLSAVSQDYRSISRQGSVLQGTHNSMIPKYQASMAVSDIEDSQLIEPVSQDKNMIQMKTFYIEPSKKNEQIKKSTTMNPDLLLKQSTNDKYDTIAFRDSDLDENFDDQPLNLKYNKLKSKQVKTCLQDFQKRKLSQNYNK